MQEPKLHHSPKLLSLFPFRALLLLRPSPWLITEGSQIVLLLPSFSVLHARLGLCIYPFIPYPGPVCFICSFQFSSNNGLCVCEHALTSALALALFNRKTYNTVRGAVLLWTSLNLAASNTCCLLLPHKSKGGFFFSFYGFIFHLWCVTVPQ